MMIRDFPGTRRLAPLLILGLLSFASPAAPPTVVSTAPADTATGVILGAGICVTFSTAMDHPSTEGAFAILPATAGSFSWNGATLIFQPAADLAPNTAYQISIGATAQDSIGTPMGTPFTSGFTTGTIVGTPLPSGLIKTLLHLGASASDCVVNLPYHGDEMEGRWDFFQLGGLGPEYLQQPVDGRPAPMANITTTSTPLVWTAMTDPDGDGIWDNNLADRYAGYAALYLAVPTPRRIALAATFDDTLTVWLDGNPLPVLDSVASSPAFDLTQGVHLLFIKHGDVTSNDFYSLKVTDEFGADQTDLRYLLDDVLPPRILSAYPAGGATGVSGGTDVVIQFGEAMDTSVPASGVASLGGGTATGTWSWTDSYTLVWTPSAPLDAATLYTVTLAPAQAKDLRGLDLTGPSTFSFTTATLSSPAAVSVLPASAVSGATANLVALNGSGFQTGAVQHPAGALPFGGHYYKFSNAWDYWNNARPACAAAGGHLSTIDSAAEDAYVWGLGGKYNCWIGMSDVVLPGGWRWENGAAVTYTNWAPGEPNNWLGMGEHWGAYWYGLWWNDTPDSGRPWICEFEKAAPPSVLLRRGGQPDLPATNVVFNSSGSVSFSLNLAGALQGVWDVVLTNPDGGTTTSAGSGTTDLTFHYTVVSGHNSADLDYLSASALAANGGTIRNSTNSDALLTLPSPGAAGSLGANKNLQIVTPPPPTLTNVTSTTPDGTYGIGQVVAVTVEFSQAVSVTGTPQLVLETGSVDAVVDYSGGSGTSTLTFLYTVASGHNSADLDYGSTASLSANGGSIRNAGNADAILTLPSPGAAGSLGANKNLQIVTPAPPTVTNVTSSTADGTYGAGDTLTILLTFSQAVTVTGGPRIVLETGAVDAVASYSAGSGGPTLSFTYAVSAADASADLDYVGSGALGLNGGTIRNASNVDALLTLPAPGAPGSLGANKNLVIFTAAPPPAPPPQVVNIQVGGCGATGAEALLLLLILRLAGRGKRVGSRRSSVDG
ncbi:MAG: Ig-like domain-containing protein [Planctomycetes bacterium]|nr:Ig-like domain-containing protein [Planctomycetota bacterium]